MLANPARAPMAARGNSVVSNLFTELKRRNVIRVAVAYLVISWLIVQVIGVLLPMFDVSASFQRGVVLLLVVGFLPAIFFSWAFEITPEGVKKEKDVERDDSVTNVTARKLEILTLVAAIGVAGLFGWQQINPPSVNVSTQVETAGTGVESDLVGKDVALNGDDVVDVQTTAGGSAAESALTLGVAVLPFANLSQDENNAFFAGGVHEDVLTYLSRIDQLRIISRTSMLKVAERGMEVRDIGKHLDVSHVLEGSVRRAADKVRVTVQLIDAATDEHLWAENYDRELKDIFAIQTEIAKAIASQLKTELSPNAQQALATFPTENIAAYDLFSKTREIRKVWRGSDMFREMIPLLEQALILDPDFVEAEVMLAENYGRMNWTNADPNESYLAKATNLTNRIVSQYPDSPYANEALANYEYTIERDYQQSLNYFQRALAVKPNDPNILQGIASSHKRLGQFEQGISVMRKLNSLDPENPSYSNELAIQLLSLGQPDEALAVSLATYKKAPSDNNRGLIADIYIGYYGDLDKALAFQQELPLEEQWGTLYHTLNLNQNNVEEYINDYQAIRERRLNEGDNIYAVIPLDIHLLWLLKSVERDADAQTTAVSLLAEYQRRANKGPTEKWQYTSLTSVACYAKDEEKFNEYETAYLALEWRELFNTHFETRYFLALAECGQTEKAWRAIKESKAQHTGAGDITNWTIALDPIFAYYFSDLPEFQAIQKEMLAIKAAREAQ